MQERIERWLCYWVAKPISWAIYGLWLAVKYAYVGGARKIGQLRERWKAWCAKRQMQGNAQLPFTVPTKRAGRREVVGK